MTGTTPVRSLTIATRGSALALAQARWVAERLAAAWPGLPVELAVVRTRGDDEPGADVVALGQGVFVREVQQAVLDGRADLAVHSYKDVPTVPVAGLAVNCVPEREDPRDALVSRRGVVFAYLDDDARVGTSSRRRAAQLLRRRATLRVEPVRGNVDTRLQLVDDGALDALVVAAAGLKRLGRADRIAEAFDVDVMVPAAGQGALALETRAEDDAVVATLAPLHDAAAAYAVTAERACLAALGGGCNVPIGLHATAAGGDLRMEGIVLPETGGRAARIHWSGPQPADPAQAGRTLAELLLATGAHEVLHGAHS